MHDPVDPERPPLEVLVRRTSLLLRTYGVCHAALLDMLEIVMGDLAATGGSITGPDGAVLAQRGHADSSAVDSIAASSIWQSGRVVGALRVHGPLRAEAAERLGAVAAELGRHFPPTP